MMECAHCGLACEARTMGHCPDCGAMVCDACGAMECPDGPTIAPMGIHARD